MKNSKLFSLLIGTIISFLCNATGELDVVLEAKKKLSDDCYRSNDVIACHKIMKSMRRALKADEKEKQEMLEAIVAQQKEIKSLREMLDAENKEKLRKLKKSKIYEKNFKIKGSMKSSKLFLLLASATLSFFSNASEDGQTKALVPVEQVIHVEMVPWSPEEEQGMRQLELKNLIGDCYHSRGNACDQLQAILAYKMMFGDITELHNLIASQQQTIASQQETIKGLRSAKKSRREKRLKEQLQK